MSRRATKFTVASTSLVSLTVIALTAPPSISAETDAGSPRADVPVSIQALRAGRLLDLTPGEHRRPLSLSAVREDPDPGYVPALDARTGTEAVLDLAMADLGVLAASSASFVEISWTNSPHVISRDVYRDDLLIATTEAETYRDTDVTPGASHVYRVEAVTASASQETGSPPLFSVNAQVPDDAETTLDAASDMTLAVALATDTSSSHVKARTFIPQSKISAPPVGCSYGSAYDFGGDGRTYSPNTGTHRTQLSVGLRWDYNDPRMTGYSHNVGATKVYNSSGTLVATKTASASGIWAKELGSDSDQVDVRFSVEASNPFCSAGAIAGAWTMNLYKNGNWAIRSGSHRQMPNWEIYATWGYPVSWRTVYKKGYQNVTCLIQSACESAQMGGYTGDY